MSFLLSLGGKLLGAIFSHVLEANINLNNDRKLVFIIFSAEWKTERKIHAIHAMQMEGSIWALLPVLWVYYPGLPVDTLRE